MLKTIRSLRGFLQRRELKSNVTRPARSGRRKPLRVESLEDRRVLAALNALPGIDGFVFADTNENGQFDAGEGLQGATVRVFQDDGDGVFDANTDTQIGADLTTDAQGEYCADNLDGDANFFVLQPAQVVAGHNLEEQVSNLITITPSLIIDDFVTAQSTVAEPPPISNDSSSLLVASETEVIGRERDLAVELTTGTSEVQLRVNPFGLASVLLFDSSAGSTGERFITWDGPDADGDALAMGLNGRDLTAGGTLGGIVARLGVDANGANARLRLYQGDETNFSEATFAIPVTGGSATETVFIPFSSFAGSVNANNVDAIELFLDTGNTSVDGQIDTIGVLGPARQDFSNDVEVDVELTKAVNVAEADNGDQVTWTLTVTNNSSNANGPVSGVTVTDVLPNGVTLVSATPSNGTFNNGVWTLADPLATGASETLAIVTTIDGDVTGGTTLTNTAQVTAHNEDDIDSTPNNDDGDQSEDDEDNASVTVRSQIDLEVNKTSDKARANAGEQVTFTVTVTNNDANANASATGVQLTDVLPNGVTLSQATPSGNGQYNSATGVWSLVDPLAPGATATLSLVTTVDSGLTGDSTVQNVAQVTAANEDDVDSTVNNDDGDQSEDDEDAAEFTVGARVDLELTKSVDNATIAAGEQLVWTLTVTNNQANANTAATNVQITDVLPAGVTLVTATPNGNAQFNNGVWSLVDPLAPGASATLTLTTTVNSGLSGGTQLTNTAQVTGADQPDVDSTVNNDDGDQSEDDEDNATSQVQDRIDLELTKAVSSANVNVGDQVTWTVTVTNNQANANTTATGVQITDALPAGVTLVTATPSNGTFANNVWTLADGLAPGATQTLTLLTTVNANNAGGTQIVNTAQVTAANETDVDSTVNNDDGDQSEDDEDVARTEVAPVIDLEVTKTVDRANAAIGDQVTWTVTVTNNQANANTNATGVTLGDVIPAGLTLVSSNATEGSFANNVWTMTDPLSPGESETLTLVTTVDSGPAGPITNVAQVTAANENDVDSNVNNDDGDQSEDDEAAAVVNREARIDLELDKAVSVTSANVGDQVTWTLTLTNNQANATSDATGVTVADVLPTGVTLVSSNPSIGSFANNTWTLGSAIAPGASATLALVTTVNNQVSGGSTIRNVAQVATANEDDFDSSPNNDDGDQSEDDEDNAELTSNAVVDVSVDKSVDRTNVSVGDTVTWTIRVANDGANANSAASGLVIRDVLPAGLTFVSSDTANGSYDQNSGNWTLASSLGVGESATLELVTTVAQVAVGTNLLNVAEVSSQTGNDIDSQPNNDDGDQSQDDEDGANVTVRPLSKRALLASNN